MGPDNPQDSFAPSFRPNRRVLTTQIGPNLMFLAPTGTLVSQDLDLAWLWASSIAAGKADCLSETSTSVLSQQQTSVLSQQQTSVLSPQQTPCLLQEQAMSSVGRTDTYLVSTHNVDISEVTMVAMSQCSSLRKSVWLKIDGNDPKRVQNHQAENGRQVSRS